MSKQDIVNFQNSLKFKSNIELMNMRIKLQCMVFHMEQMEDEEAPAKLLAIDNELEYRKENNQWQN